LLTPPPEEPAAPPAGIQLAPFQVIWHFVVDPPPVIAVPTTHDCASVIVQVVPVTGDPGNAEKATDAPQPVPPREPGRIPFHPNDSTVPPLLSAPVTFVSLLTEFKPPALARLQFQSPPIPNATEPVPPGEQLEFP